jgi:hypothetical protein
MSTRRLCVDYELRGKTYELWTDFYSRFLVDPRRNEIVDTDRAFAPPLTNDELLGIYDYGKGY